MSRDLEPSKRVPHLPDESPNPSRDLRFPGTYDRFARLAPIDGDEESAGTLEEEPDDEAEAGHEAGLDDKGESDSETESDSEDESDSETESGSGEVPSDTP